MEMAELIGQKTRDMPERRRKVGIVYPPGDIVRKGTRQSRPAIDAFRYALSLDQNRLDVLKALDWLYLRKKKWQELADICAREIELVPEVKDKRNYAIG